MFFIKICKQTGVAVKVITHPSICVIADTHFSTEQIDYPASDKEYTHPLDTCVKLLLNVLGELHGSAEVSASAYSMQQSSAVTNWGWIKLLRGNLVLIQGSAVLTSSIPLCTEAVSSKCSHFQLHPSSTYC